MNGFLDKTRNLSGGMGGHKMWSVTKDVSKFNAKSPTSLENPIECRIRLVTGSMACLVTEKYLVSSLVPELGIGTSNIK
jgi:hypothetical protein